MTDASAPGATFDPDAATVSEAGEQRSLPSDIEHLGPLRRAVLDHLLDTAGAGPQSVAAIISALPPGTSRNTAESAIKRCFDAGQLERVAPGTYALAKPKRPEPAASPGPVGSGYTDEQWLVWIGEWRATREWKGPGNSPDQPGCLVPLGVIAKHNERVRKRLERQRDREAALERQREADRQLRDALLNACRHGRYENYTPALVVDDLGPVKALLALGVSLARILLAVQWRTQNDRLVTWRDELFLKKAWEYFGRFDIIPRLLSMSKAAGKVPQKPASASEGSARVLEPAAAETAPTVPPANSIDPSGCDASVLGPMAAALIREFGSADRRPHSPKLARVTVERRTRRK